MASILRRLLLCILFVSTAQAWTYAGKGLQKSILLGMEYASAREDLLIPLAFQGPGILLGSSVGTRISGWDLDMEANVKLDVVFDRFMHPGAITSLRISPAFGHKLPKPLLGMTLFTGLSLPLELNNQFLFSWDDAHLYWFSIRGLSTYLRWKGSFKQDRTVFGELVVPLLSQISRPAAKRFEKQDPSLMSLGFFPPPGSRSYSVASIADYQGYELRLGMDRYGSKGSWMIELDFDHYTLPQPTWVVSTALIYRRSWGK